MKQGRYLRHYNSAATACQDVVHGNISQLVQRRYSETHVPTQSNSVEGADQEESAAHLDISEGMKRSRHRCQAAK